MNYFDSTSIRTAIVTGASSGIGAATARRLASAGYAVSLVARRSDRLEALAREIRAEGRSATVIPADLADATNALAVVEQATQESGRLDAVVNASGVMLIGSSVEQDASEWERMIDVNLRGLLHLTKACLPSLLETAKSHQVATDVVNVSSVAGRVVAPMTAVYTATKFAVTAATEAWRQEFAGTGVRFSVIEPGFVATELGSFQEATQQFYDMMSTDHEILRADDVASAVEYVITSPARVAINEIVIRPAHQA
jgi:NADP-dependent 3-hydroxy acid dehydrogenase YdfG